MVSRDLQILPKMHSARIQLRRTVIGDAGPIRRPEGRMTSQSHPWPRLGVTGAALLGLAGTAAAQQKPPTFVILMTDDAASLS